MERIYIIYPTVVVLPNVRYSPSEPHFEQDSPTFRNWERKGEQWKLL